MVVCTASDSLGTLLQLIKKRRVHRLVVVEGEVCNLGPSTLFYNADFHSLLQEEERKGGKKGRLLGVITLSDVLRYVIGNSGIGECVEPPEEEPKSPPTESGLKKENK